MFYFLHNNLIQNTERKVIVCLFFSKYVYMYINNLVIQSKFGRDLSIGAKNLKNVNMFLIYNNFIDLGFFLKNLILKKNK